MRQVSVIILGSAVTNSNGSAGDFFEVIMTANLATPTDAANRAYAQLRSPGERGTPAEDLAHPAQTPLLPLARRHAGQGHSRPSGPRDRRMKNAHWLWHPAL